MSVRVLALDTTGEIGSLALAIEDRIIEQVELNSLDGFAHVIFVEIERLLARHQVTLRDIDCFASASGPGSFTGVRVGLTAAKGLAEATGKKVIAISNLQALAWHGTRPLRAPVIDARRGEIYGAVYNAELECVQEEIVTTYENWRAALPAPDSENDIEIITARPALAGAIALIAARQFAAGLGKDPAEIDANYVRRSDAELLWKDPSAG
ncbi:MAG TPA: tRNA (adenosine(37)-N6)-threonylcarbamoyltransferase complex dimerization subunit type 1 TsaB [Bryobacteraceae bacterium]|nr:tRNA (adenosine(37)-N6)-threonylcarbamoyltransferase complex dimerization subunit type 1 TsaB [Bryobacteraceae bacterium]